MRARQKAACYLSLGVASCGAAWRVGTAHIASAGAYDPRTYHVAEEPAPALLARAVYRLDGRRYLQFVATGGSVFLPAAGDEPTLRADAALCPRHLHLLREVLPLRTHLPIDPTAQRLAPAVLALIADCNHGRIPGPVNRERQPDGAIIERRAASPALK